MGGVIKLSASEVAAIEASDNARRAVSIDRMASRLRAEKNVAERRLLDSLIAGARFQ